jgi:hypothetical protein
MVAVHLSEPPDPEMSETFDKRNYFAERISVIRKLSCTRRAISTSKLENFNPAFVQKKLLDENFSFSPVGS